MNYLDTLIKRDEIDRYYINGRDFIDDDAIRAELAANATPDPARIRDLSSRHASMKPIEGKRIISFAAIPFKEGQSPSPRNGFLRVSYSDSGIRE